MLGLGWFPDSLGGLDRYYRSLMEQLPGARGIVVGPARDAPPAVSVVAPGSLLRRLVSFARAARRVAPGAEIVDAHFALYALLPLYDPALRGLPKVFHFHGPWAEESVAAGDPSTLRRRLRRALEGRALRRAEELVVLSGAFRRVLAERYGIGPWNVHVWRPGVELDRFRDGDRRAAREQLGLPAGGFVVVCARRLVARMGVDVLLDAWEASRDRLPAGSTLLLVGEGPLRDDLQQRAGRPPLAGSVRMLGRVTDAQLCECYRAADAAVVPSLAFEGFGLVVLEAAACGTPSIVSDVGGLPEAIAPLDRSLVVAPGDPAALAERLAAAAQGALPSRAETRAYAERFDWREVARRHRDLYSRLCSGGATRRPRVVVLDHVARLSGGEIALLRVLPAMEGVDLHVILAEPGPLADRLQEAGISVEVLPLDPAARDARKGSLGRTGASPRATLHTALYVLRLARRLRRLRPDVVHTNSLKSGLYGGAAARLARVPVLWHLRDRVAEDYLPGPAVRLVRGSIGALADAVVANSGATLETVPAGRRNRVREVIPDSVTPPQLPQRGGGGREPVFGMLGRIAPWKGQDLFLRAFAAAFPEGPERAVIVGMPLFGEEEFERDLHRLVGELGLEARVEFRGFREDVWSELAAMDVLVHASVIPEPFGQVVLEGMAAGLAVIAPDEGGPASIIDDGRTGRLFRSRDQRSLTAAMVELRDDPGERERLGRAARDALGEYLPEAVAARLVDVYSRLSRVS